ncbi:hypothetical protein DTO207G8_6785 [Paecilomyces variotii]|nr:hypothetical protein DTO207G8_6785 [Paecilomyces variotii]KAJ9378620.1 hypothetical protein DTO063F5_7598 [Paecilomyces variotii]
MCFYKPNAPPCTCTVYELFQPCWHATFYPAPKPLQNPNPIIRVCGTMNIALSATPRQCLVCESAVAFTGDLTAGSYLVDNGENENSLSSQNQSIGSHDNYGESDIKMSAMMDNLDLFSSLGQESETEPMTSTADSNALNESLFHDFGSLLPDYGEVQSLL